MSQHYFEKLITQTQAEYKQRPLEPGVDASNVDGNVIAPLIDHTLLKPEARQTDVLRLCEEAKEYGFASVCVNPTWVPLCVELLEDSDILICTVAGFPLGANTTETKALEAEELAALEVPRAVRLTDGIETTVSVADLRVGDIIVRMNDIPIFSRREALLISASTTPGDTVNVTGIRDGERFTTTVVAGERPQGLYEPAD